MSRRVFGDSFGRAQLRPEGFREGSDQKRQFGHPWIVPEHYKIRSADWYLHAPKGRRHWRAFGFVFKNVGIDPHSYVAEPGFPAGMAKDRPAFVHGGGGGNRLLILLEVDLGA
jgi:hypothetical protein